MPRASVNFSRPVIRNKNRQASVAVGPQVPKKASTALLIAIALFLMMFQQDAVAHSGSFHHGAMNSGQFHHGGMNSGQFHHPNVNNGQFHRGHFHHGPHGVVILVPPLLSYSSPPAYFYPSVTAGQVAPMSFIEQGPDGTTLSFWYYCVNPAGYYPNVQQCQSGWQLVQASSSY